MRLIAIDSARATLLFPLEEVFPLDGLDSKAVLTGIAQRYEFAKYPSLDQGEIGDAGLKFETGRIKRADKYVDATHLDIYRDGIVATAGTTDTAEEIINDLMQWLRTEFKFRSAQSSAMMYFMSHVVIEFDASPHLIIADHDRLSGRISSKVSKYFPLAGASHFVRLDYELEGQSADGLQVPRFVIERRPGVPLDRRRYFSSAPLMTQEHIELLNEIEEMLT